MQTDLFDLPVKATKKDSARKLRDRGIQRAVDHANSVQPEWSDKAIDHLRTFIANLLRKGDHLTSESVRAYATTHGLPHPPDKRAWGAVMLKAAKLGYVRKIGWTTASDPKVHCNPVSLWEVL